MIKSVLQSISGVETYSIISLILFLAAFILVVIWVMSLDKQEIRRCSLLPLEDSLFGGEAAVSGEAFSNRAEE